MQGRERSEGMSKSETGLQSLSLGSWIRARNREGRAGLSMQISKNETKVCGWMGYTVEGLRTSSGRGDAWIGVLVRCYTECNTLTVIPSAISGPVYPRPQLVHSVNPPVLKSRTRRFKGRSTQAESRSICPHPIQDSVTIRSGVDTPLVQRQRNPSDLAPIIP